MLIFVLRSSEDIYAAINNAAAPGIQVMFIDNDDDALVNRESTAQLTKGIFVIETRYSRGYDLKLAKDAIVLILDNDGTLRLSDAEQMAGRASRAQSKQVCIVRSVVTGAAVLGPTGMKGLLAARDRVVIKGSQGAVIRALLKLEDAGTLKTNTQICNLIRQVGVKCDLQKAAATPKLATAAKALIQLINSL